MVGSCAELHDLMPGILNQMGADNLQSLKRLAQQFPEGGGGGPSGMGLMEEDDDDDDDGEKANVDCLDVLHGAVLV